MQTVSQFVGEDGADFLRGHSVDQIVVQYDGLQLAEAGEISIELRGAARGIHHLNGFHLIAVLVEQCHEIILQLTVFQRDEFIANPAENGIQERNCQRKDKYRGGEQRDHPVPQRSVQAGQQPCQQQAQDQIQQQIPDLIRHKGLEGGAVEAVLFFNHHGTVILNTDAHDKIHRCFQNHHSQKLQENTAAKQSGKGGISIDEEQSQGCEIRKNCRNQMYTAVFRTVPPPSGIGFGIVNVRYILRNGIAGRFIPHNIQYQTISSTQC